MENLNWSELGFGYIKTDYNVRCYYRDGKWEGKRTYHFAGSE